MRVIIYGLTLLGSLSASAVTTYHLASKCVPVEDSAITRRIGATSGVWVTAERNCEDLAKIAINQSNYYSKAKTYFPGITMDYNCIKVSSPAKWRSLGCSGGLELGYLLEVTADIENPNKYKWYYPKEKISYYKSEKSVQECLYDAQNFIWFSTDQVQADAECQDDGKNILRSVKLKFKQ